MYLHQKISTVYLLCLSCIVKHFDNGFGGMGMFKGGLRGRGRVNSEINYRN